MSVFLLPLLASVASSLAKGTAASHVACFRASAGVDGIARVKNWPGGWKKETHAKHVFEAFDAGLFARPRWEAVTVDPRLVVYVMHDALAIGDSPPCRIPINQSNCQRLADKIGWQLGTKLVLPTPKIVDAVHLAALKSGRELPLVSIYSDGEKYEGQSVPQWLRQQERLRNAVTKAGGYPAAGIISTVGKDVTTSPQIVDVATSTHVGKEGVGPKMEIYGWCRKGTLKDAGPNGPSRPHTTALLSAGYMVQQSESTVHGDFDNGETGAGGFWDYSSTVRFVAGLALLDGKQVNLADVYELQPELVYDFGGAKPRKIPSRYPMVPPPKLSR